MKSRNKHKIFRENQSKCDAHNQYDIMVIINFRVLNLAKFHTCLNFKIT